MKHLVQAREIFHGNHFAKRLKKSSGRLEILSASSITTVLRRIKREQPQALDGNFFSLRNVVIVLLSCSNWPLIN